MGFYLELREKELNVFSESQIPLVYWILTFILGFALCCMGLSVRSLLPIIFTGDSLFDYLLLGTYVASWAFFAFMVVRLGFARKYVALKGDRIEVGYEVFGYSVFTKTVLRGEIKECEISLNRKSPNVGASLHDNDEYYFKGHYQVGVITTDGSKVILDKSTDRDVLSQLFESVNKWLVSGV